MQLKLEMGAKRKPSLGSLELKRIGLSGDIAEQQFLY